MVMHPAPFDPKIFLAMVGDGRSIGTYRKGQLVYSQGEPAEEVFYIQNGKVKVTVVSEHGKKQLSQCFKRTSFSAKRALPGRPCA